MFARGSLTSKRLLSEPHGHESQLKNLLTDSDAITEPHKKSNATRALLFVPHQSDELLIIAKAITALSTTVRIGNFA